jgi:exodeoxyribonuclease VII large subunit
MTRRARDLFRARFSLSEAARKRSSEAGQKWSEWRAELPFFSLFPASLLRCHAASLLFLVTQRPLFDPQKMAAKPRVIAPTESDTPLSVSQLAARIDASLKAGIPVALRVTGEVSGFRDRTHWYFDLKDADAVVNCAMFMNVAKKAGFTPANGQQVVVRGRVDFYAKGGKVTLIVEKIEPVGAGALELAYRKLCEELKAAGYFALERKRPLPTFPRRIAVVTSKSGAALQDVLVTMNKRCPAVGVLIVDARMQGDDAAPEIAAAINRLSRDAEKLGLDAILVTRGGGSMEDLWAFNERIVADAILNCSIPIVAAIGHETDTTIAELVADERGATPTQAAMRLTPDMAALLQQLDTSARRLWGQLARRLSHERERLRSVERFTLFRSPTQFVAGAKGRLDGFASLLRKSIASALRDSSHNLDKLATRFQASRPAAVHAKTLQRLEATHQRLRQAQKVALERAATHIESLDRQLNAVGPLRVLERGYSVTLTPDGRALRSEKDAKPGDRLTTRVADGAVRSIVEGGEHAPLVSPSTPVRGPRVCKPRKQAKGDPNEPGLFS